MTRKAAMHRRPTAFVNDASRSVSPAGVHVMIKIKLPYLTDAIFKHSTTWFSCKGLVLQRILVFETSGTQSARKINLLLLGKQTVHEEGQSQTQNALC